MQLKHVCGVDDLSDRLVIDHFLDLADKLRRQEELVGRAPQSLLDKTVLELAYKTSMRTSLFFDFATRALGGGYVLRDKAGDFSAGVSGQDLEQTIRSIQPMDADRNYPSAIVLRHPKRGSALAAKKFSSVPIINAGEGGGVDGDEMDHPTQVLQDLYTIRKKRGKIAGAVVGVVGDFGKKRIIHSLVRKLALYEGVQVRFYADTAPLDEDREFLRERNVGCEVVVPDYSFKDLDVLYVTQSAPLSFGSAVVDSRRVNEMKKEAIVMAPLPAGSELAREVYDDPRSVFFTEQRAASRYTKMGVLQSLIVPGFDEEKKA